MLTVKEFLKANDLNHALRQDPGVSLSGPCDKTKEPKPHLTGPCDITEGHSSSDMFTEGMKAKHIVTGKIGIVQAAFPGTGILYEPHEVPVIWDGDYFVSGVPADSIKQY
jgi:hypothetical protein